AVNPDAPAVAFTVVARPGGLAVAALGKANTVSVPAHAGGWITRWKLFWHGAFGSYLIAHPQLQFRLVEQPQQQGFQGEPLQVEPPVAAARRGQHRLMQPHP